MPTFTVDDANRRLPLVRTIVEDIVNLYADVTQRRQRLAEICRLRPERKSSSTDVYIEEVEQDERDLKFDALRLRGFVEELHSLGVELKDPEIGLVDFRATLNERDVYLCWKLGENEITHWHDLDEGFAGRRPLMQEALAVDLSRD